VKLVSPIGGAPGGSGNQSTSLYKFARMAAHPKFVWIFNANYDGTIIYNDPVDRTGRAFPNFFSNNLNRKINIHKLFQEQMENFKNLFQ
jgi:hypothetical protein